MVEIEGYTLTIQKIEEELKIKVESQEHKALLQDMIRRSSLPESHTNLSKRKARKVLLSVHPEEMIRIDKEKLRIVMPQLYQVRCNSRSSIAEDLAIKGSDIDGGIVITEGDTDFETQVEFINELRRQGFIVYHPSEVDEESKKVQRAEQEYRERHISIDVVIEVQYTFLEIESKVLYFVSKQGLGDMIVAELESGEGRLTPIIDTYLSGKIIISV